VFPYPFDREYMQLALAAGVVVGASAPLIGTFLVQRRLSLLGDGIGHLAFAGVAFGLLVGIWPVWTALVVAVVAAVGMERLRSRGRASGDLALALFFYSGIAAGVVLVAGLGVLIVVTVGVCGRAMFAVVLDEESARVGGLPVDGLNSLLAALAAITVVAAMRVVGILLVAALMVLPVATAQLVARSFRSTLWMSAVIGAAAAVAGLAAARIWGLAPGGTIVLVAAGTFAVTSIGFRRGRAWPAGLPRVGS
jgi:zinc transport system permease protein